FGVLNLVDSTRNTTTPWDWSGFYCLDDNSFHDILIKWRQAKLSRNRRMDLDIKFQAIFYCAFHQGNRIEHSNTLHSFHGIIVVHPEAIRFALGEDVDIVST